MEKELRIRIGSDLKSQLEKRAEKLNISLSAYCRMVLSQSDLKGGEVFKIKAK